MNDTRHDVEAISDALMNARRDGLGLPGFPGKLPETLEQAYAVQHRSMRLWPDEVQGWKVGGVPAAFLDRFTQSRLVGPIFRKKIVHADLEEETVMPVLPGFAAVEGEFVFCLGETEAQNRLYIGIEVASSPLPAINDIGPAAIISDFGNNNGLVVGPEIADWRTCDPDIFTVATQIDGVSVGSRQIADFPGDALEALRFLREHSAHYGVALPAGTFVSSGAITGVHEAQAGARSIVDFGPFGRLKLQFTAAQTSG